MVNVGPECVLEEVCEQEEAVGHRQTQQVDARRVDAILFEREHVDGEAVADQTHDYDQNCKVDVDFARLIEHVVGEYVHMARIAQRLVEHEIIQFCFIHLFFFIMSKKTNYNLQFC